VAKGRLVIQPLQGAEGGRDGLQQQRFGQRPHRRNLGGQFLFRGGVDGQVEPGAEQAAVAAGDPVGQVAGVVGGGFGVGIVQAALSGVVAAARFEPGALLAQLGGGHGGRDWLDVHGDVEPAGVAGQRFQPARPDLGRVAGHREGRGPPVPDPQMPGGDLDTARPCHHVRGG
jgi:hypothetical protein